LDDSVEVKNSWFKLYYILEYIKATKCVLMTEMSYLYGILNDEVNIHKQRIIIKIKSSFN